MNELLTQPGDPMFDEIEQARLAAAQAQGATVEEGIDPASGNDVVRIEAGHSTIEAASDFQPATNGLEIDTSRVEASTEKDTPNGHVNYKAHVVTHRYPDGDSFSSGQAEIYRTLPNGKEVIRRSNNPERARQLTSAIASRMISEARSDRIR